jgi:hypothetical protein
MISTTILSWASDIGAALGLIVFGIAAFFLIYVGM